MAKYFVANTLSGSQQNIGSSYKTLLAMFCSATPRRGKLYDLEVGTDGTPADGVLTWDVSRMTVDGTGTGATPLPLDPADAAALTTCKDNYTVEPTITAASSLNVIPENQRATYRWCAFPGSELVWPATAANGLVVRAKSAQYAGTAIASAYFDEQ